MSLAIQPKPEDEPHRMAVASDGLMPRMWLHCKKPVGRFPKGTIRKILGVNFSENSVLTEGENPPETRLYMQFGGHEYLYEPLKKPIEEIVLDESPEYELVLLDPKIIPLYPPEADSGCKVIQHPASFTPERIPRKAKKKGKNKTGPNQIFFYPPTDLNLTA